MAGFPFMRQAETFLSSLPFILLLAVFILPCPMSAAAKPRPAIAFVHLLLPPGGEPMPPRRAGSAALTGRAIRWNPCVSPPSYLPPRPGTPKI